MSKQLFKALLTKDFWTKANNLLPSSDVFPSELRGLYQTLMYTHSKYEGDISLEDLKSLHYVLNPTLTPSSKLIIEEQITALLNDPFVYNQELALDVLYAYRKQESCRYLIEQLLEFERDPSADWESLLNKVRDQRDQVLGIELSEGDQEDDGVVDLDDLEHLLEDKETLHKWKFNYAPLQRATNGLPESSFGIVGARPDCYSEDTEVLTDSGWKLFSNLSIIDLVAQVNTKLEVDFVKPTAYTQYEYTGEMVHFTHTMGKVDLLVTPNHDMVLLSDSLEFRKCKASAFNPKYDDTILKAGVKLQGRNSLTPYERFLIAYQADGSGPRKGCTGERGHYTVRFSFSKQRKVDRLLFILGSAKLVHTVVKEKAKPNYTTVYVQVPTLPSKTFDWVKLQEVSGTWAEEFIEELSHWDATRRSSTRIKYDSTVKLNTDVVSGLCAITGYHTNQSIYVDKRGFKDIHTITILTDRATFLAKPIKKQIVEYTGVVYCVTVPSGMILVRRNGKTVVCGNCGKTAFYLSLCMNEGGFVHQGANVAVWRNEERYDMVAKRAISSLLGVPFDEAVLNLEGFREVRSKLKGNLSILKDSITGDASIDSIDKYLAKNPHINILVIDQLDNVLYEGKRAGDDVQILGALYNEARAIGTRRNVSIIAITQAGGEADGKLYYGLNGLYGSKTNKQAAADYIFCIGANKVEDGAMDQGVRMINFAKNKLKGPHHPVPYKLIHNVSRIGE